MGSMLRRTFLGTLMTGGTLARSARTQQAPQAAGKVFLERLAAGQPHKGKVLLALQAHSDDIPLSASGTPTVRIRRKARQGTWDRDCGLSWRSATSACRCWAMTTSLPIAITSRSSG